MQKSDLEERGEEKATFLTVSVGHSSYSHVIAKTHL